MPGDTKTLVLLALQPGAGSECVTVIPVLNAGNGFTLLVLQVEIERLDPYGAQGKFLGRQGNACHQ